MNRASITFLLLTFFQFSSAYACGDYLISAQVRAENEYFVLIVNPGTISEIRLRADTDYNLKLAAYENRFIETKIKMIKEMDRTRGEIESLGSITVLVPDPKLVDQGTSMKLLSKSDCKK